MKYWCNSGIRILQFKMSLGMIRLHGGAEVTDLGHMQMSCCNIFTMCWSIWSVQQNNKHKTD